MAYRLDEKLVIGISSRALFDLKVENEIFETRGVKAYCDYQVEHEQEILKPGPGFELVRSLLRLNEFFEGQGPVEVVVMSRNSPDTSLRVFNAIEHYGLPITRAALVSGASLAPYLAAFHTDLFLSAHEDDVQWAIDGGIAAGIICTEHIAVSETAQASLPSETAADRLPAHVQAAKVLPFQGKRNGEAAGAAARSGHPDTAEGIGTAGPPNVAEGIGTAGHLDAANCYDAAKCSGGTCDQMKTVGAADCRTEAREVSDCRIRIAFDGDAVIFSDESERIFKERGLHAFEENEAVKAKSPLEEGPFASFLRKLSALQDALGREDCPIRTALVTSRCAPAHERVIRTLRTWKVHVDEAFFLGGMEKREFLRAFGAQIFFDDQSMHTDSASQAVPAARVPYKNAGKRESITDEIPEYRTG